ncbi:RNA polymerase sigma factor [Spongiactinospora sp. TRM90649]|uniref:RNA polymerase sigma factor n=1 Tax=Spongiactinospora sp. TRM90649 TaxID=3031114 RepID=UPI0023FA3F32|nr:RNA polymerase sigma factor [Spongiactinospora sp. TRM90649]MDF5751631.1 RNA polymerase sigma factor [Spongiactinospora sp. TRM90649]
MTEAHPSAVRRAVDDAHRREWARVLATTVRVARDLDLAEECVQDAYVAALGAWARGGVPTNPGAWLVTVARRNALDALRRDRVLRSKLHLLAEDDVEDDVGSAEGGAGRPEIHDDRLRLIFMCCHPALRPEAQIALTLRLVCGVATTDIASAFLVPEPTMAARITRAKKKIAGAGVPFRVPGHADLPERLDAVLTVVHLLFTTGHTAPSGGGLTREDLAVRALDLTRLLRELLPGEREVRGLLALLLVNHARRAGRTDGDGRLVLLSEQDRSLWDRAAIAEGHRLVVAALRGGPPGRFTLQAAIAALHATAPTYADTDWEQILVLYGELLGVWPSPVVALNRAVVLAMVHGPEKALRETERLEAAGELGGYHYLPAVKGDLLRRMDRPEEAAREYRRALDLTANEAERAFLTGRLAECGAP